ncbi:MAG: Pascal38 [Gemmatimonadetes bacterium]|nr:Pascal38 [Gemmatimonadota bacterium]
MTRRYGYLKLSRKLFDPEREDSFWLEKRSFSRFEAWIDLLQLAPWTDYSVTSGATIEVPRGCFIASLRLLTRRWAWPKTRVERFLSLLCARDMLRRESGTPIGTLYRVVKYETYQSLRDSERDESGTPIGTKIKQSSREALQEATTTPEIVGSIMPEQSAYQIGLVSAANDASDRRFPGAVPIRWDHTGTVDTAIALQSAGVPLEFAQRIVAQKTEAMPSAPYSMKYFRDAIIDAWRAQSAPEPPHSPSVATGTDGKTRARRKDAGTPGIEPYANAFRVGIDR